jgi:hypothetical protein
VTSAPSGGVGDGGVVVVVVGAAVVAVRGVAGLVRLDGGEVTGAAAWLPQAVQARQRPAMAPAAHLARRPLTMPQDTTGGPRRSVRESITVASDIRSVRFPQTLMPVGGRVRR